MKQQEYFNSFHSITYQYFFLTLILIGSISGKLESNIICRFSSQNQTVFWNGEFVSGNIECNNSNYKGFKLKNIDLQLIGLLVHKDVLLGTRYKHSRTLTGYKTFFNQQLNLNLSNKRDSFLLSNGNYLWPCRFFLNDSLPPTLKKTKPADSYIEYFLQMIFVRPEWYKRNIKKNIPIVVRHVSSRVDTMKVEAEEKNRKDVQFHVILQKSAIVAGSNVSFDVRIQNPKEVLISRIVVVLAQHLELGPAKKRMLHLLNKTLETISQFKNSHFHENFQLHVPHTVPPSFSFHFPASNRERPIVVHYELHFEAHLRGLPTNIHLKLPLIIIDQPQI